MGPVPGWFRIGLPEYFTTYRVTWSGDSRWIEIGGRDKEFNVLLGNDAPSGTGVVPLGILRLMAHLASMGGVPPETVVALATGNTARVHGLDTGVIAPGRAADLCIVDAPVGSVGTTALEALATGDIPGVSMVIVDGVPLIGRSRNTAPAGRMAEVVTGPAVGAGGH
jgi:enamidase